MISLNVHEVVGVTIGEPLRLNGHRWQLYTFHLKDGGQCEVTAFLLPGAEPVLDTKYIPSMFGDGEQHDG